MKAILFPNNRENFREERSLSLVFELITSDKLKSATEMYRSLRSAKKRNLADVSNDALPVVCPCDGTGLVHLRFNRLADDQAGMVVDALRDVPHVALAFQGLEPGTVEVLVRYNEQGFAPTESSAENYRLYEQAKKETNRYLFQFTGRNTEWIHIRELRHKMFICHDAQAYCNPDATCLFDDLFMKKTEIQRAKEASKQSKAELKKAAKTEDDKIRTLKIMEFIERQPLIYDEIKRMIMIKDMSVNLSSKAVPADELWEYAHYRNISDRDINSLMQKCAIELGFDIAPQMFRAHLQSNVIRSVNMLREYIERLPAWDGQTDYIAQVAARVHVDSDAQQFTNGFKKWFVCMVASWMYDDVVNHVILGLFGEQGIYKTSFIESLIPPTLKRYLCKLALYERIDRDDRIMLADFGLAELDELGRLREKLLDALKSMASTVSITERQPYGIVRETRPRIASFAATGNNDKFLSDETGNRRFLPFHVNSIDSPFEHPLPYQGMYAQAYQLIQDKFQYWFSDEEIKAYSKHIRRFKAMCPEEELLLVHFKQGKKGDAGVVALSLAEIAARLRTLGNLSYTIDLRKLGQLLKNNGFTQIREGHEGVRLYLVIELNAQQIEAQHKLDAI